MSFLEVRHVQKIYTTRFGGTKVQALTDVNFTVEKGEYVAIMGESGSGKTTLLNILAALDKPTGGEVVLDGRPLSTIPEREIAAFRRSQLGFVFQEFNLLDTFSVQDNIFLPLVLAGKAYPEMAARLAPIARQLGIAELLQKFPYELSGGQKQRVAVARALITQPKLVPTSRPARSIRARRMSCCACLRMSTAAARPSSWSRTRSRRPATPRACCSSRTARCSTRSIAARARMSSSIRRSPTRSRCWQRAVSTMRNLYPRLAATNLKKNRRFYLPYLLACIVIVALFCIMLTLASDPYLGQMQHGGSVSQALGFGVFIMALFSAIILFYTNSTFTKQRKREFAIYNILGMEKRHISYVLFWESLYTAAMALFFGLVAAGVFSKLLQLVLVRLIGGGATFGLNIRLMSIGYTVVFFGALFLLLLLNTIRIIHLSNPVQLLRAGSEGEREPRSKWILALLGAVCLAAGYLISLRTNVALYAIQNFFPAVILVIIGTYLTFIALSVVVLKALRKNRRYYYKTSHFATVSGLIYRMSRNAAGLASICILSTMVLVTVSTTVSLYKGLDAYAAVRWPQDMTLTLMTDPQTNTVPDVAPVLQVVDDTMTRAGLTQSNVHGYRTVRFSAQRSGDALDLTSEQLTGSSADEYTVMVLDTEGYAGLTGEQVTLAPGEALAWTDGAAFGDTLTLGGDTLRLRQLDSFSLVSGSSIMGLHTLYLVVPDLDSVLELRAQQNAYTSEHGGTRSMLNYTYQFDLSGTDDEQLDALHALLCDPAFESAAEAANVQYTTDMRADGYPTLRSTYGGFLFLGFFLGFVFLFATVLIIYYKQVSEGYDDRGRFRIMQQVGMTPKEVKATIRTQVLLMFFLPLVTAAIHIAFAFPLIKQIVFAFGLQNVHLFLLCTLGTFGVFALLYTFVYLLTARTYYRIVRMTD